MGINSKDGTTDDQGSETRLIIERTISTGDAEVAIYHGAMKAGLRKVGQFTVRVDRRKQEMFIDEIFVERGYRGMGIGAKALAFIEAEASLLKVRKVIVDPFPIDPGAVTVEDLKRWYVKHGYTPQRPSLGRWSGLFTKTLR